MDKREGYIYALIVEKQALKGIEDAKAGKETFGGPEWDHRRLEEARKVIARYGKVFADDPAIQADMAAMEDQYAHLEVVCQEKEITMKGYDVVEAIIERAHKATTNPIVAVIAANAQAMREADCQVAIGSGTTTHEAVNDALAKAGRMENWVSVVSRLDANGEHIAPPIMDQQMMRGFRKTGLNAVFYIGEDDEWEVYNPTT